MFGKSLLDSLVGLDKYGQELCEELWQGMNCAMEKNIRQFSPVIKAISVPPIVVAALLGFVLTGCAAEGDFGRPTESLLLKKITDKVDIVGDVVFNNKSEFPVTNSEVEIRDVAYHFHQALPRPLLAQRLVSRAQWRDLGYKSDYADYLTHSDYGNGDSRVGVIESQLEGDHQQLKRFAFAAKNVLEADRERTEVLSLRAAAYSERDRKNTFSRIAENRGIIHATLRDVDKRVVSYTYAIERIRIETPDVPIGKIETILNLFRERVVYLKGMLRQYAYGAEVEVYQEPFK